MTKEVLINSGAGAGAGGPVGSTAISTASGGVSMIAADLCALARRATRPCEILASGLMRRRGDSDGLLAAAARTRTSCNADSSAVRASQPGGRGATKAFVLVPYNTLASAPTTFCMSLHSWPQLVPQRLSAFLSYAYQRIHK